MKFYLEVFLLMVLVCTVFNDAHAQSLENALIYTGLDALQTINLSKHSDFVETNPLLGESPSPEKIVKHFVTSAMIGYRVSTFLKGRNKRIWLWAWEHMEAGYVVGNCLSGVMCETNSQLMPGDAVTIKFNMRW